MSFTTGLVTPRDSLYQWVETVERLGSDLHPVIRLVYPYNPLKRELVQVDVQVMPHTLLLRMGWQLLGSLVLILLLAVCLSAVPDKDHFEAAPCGRVAEKLCQHHDTRVETSRAGLEDVRLFSQ